MTAMGGEDAPLDARCRVRGVGGLRVIDGSVMPSIVSGNTNAAIIMIGERAADLVLEDARRAPVTAQAIAGAPPPRVLEETIGAAEPIALQTGAP